MLLFMATFTHCNLQVSLSNLLKVNPLELLFICKLHVTRHMTEGIICTCPWVERCHTQKFCALKRHLNLEYMKYYDRYFCSLHKDYTIGYPVVPPALYYWITCVPSCTKLLSSRCFLLFYTIVDFARKLLILVPRLRVTRGAGLLLLLLLNPICLQDKARARQVKTVVAANNPAKITK